MSFDPAAPDSSQQPQPESQPDSAGPQCFVTREQYFILLDRLAALIAAQDSLPDCFIGMKRSGLFPAVYLSHQLSRPMLAESETKRFPATKFPHPALIDTTCWNGHSLRTIHNRLSSQGTDRITTAVMFARSDPPPNLPGLICLERALTIPHFWYERRE